MKSPYRTLGERPSDPHVAEKEGPVSPERGLGCLLVFLWLACTARFVHALGEEGPLPGEASLAGGLSLVLVLLAIRRVRRRNG